MTKVLFCSCKYGVGVIPYWYSLCVYVKYQYNERASIEQMSIDLLCLYAMENM